MAPFELAAKLIFGAVADADLDLAMWFSATSTAIGTTTGVPVVSSGPL